MSVPLPESQDLISIARIARPQGIRGEVIAELLTDFPDRFAQLDTVSLKGANGELFLLRLESARMHKDRVVLKFAGYDDMDTAEALRDAHVMITRDQLVELPADTWYDFDLIGCQVTTTGGQDLGSVAEVQNFGAAPLLVIQADDGTERMIPLVLSICIEIDTANKKIVVNPPDGLLEL